MADINTAWFADRAPVRGKLLYATPATPSSGLIGAGGLVGFGNTGTPPASFSLPAPGAIIPPPGSPDRAGFFLVFKNATGFDGQTFLSDWLPGTTKGVSYSLSAWVNVSVQALAPLSAVLDTLFINFSGKTYTTNDMYPGGGSGSFNANPVQIVLGGDTGYIGTIGSPGWNNFGDTPPSPPLAGPALYGNTLVEDTDSVPPNPAPSVYTRALTYPNHTTGSSNWLHMMFAYKMRFAQSGAAKFVVERCVCVVNDTTLFDVTYNSDGFGLVNGFIDFSATTSDVVGIGSSTLSTSGGGLVAGVAEYVLYANKFIDWTQQSERYKYHVTDGFGAFQTWAPCNIGSRGTLPGHGVPMVYCGGNPVQFPLNRATGKTLTVNTGISGGLFAVDDPPA